MNRAFFERMKTFSYWILGIGILGTAVMIFTIVFTKDPKYIYSERVFNLVGFGITVGSFLSLLCLYFILKGIALIGINSFKYEKTEQNQTEESEKPAYFKISFPKKEPIDLLPQSNSENINRYSK